MPCKTFLPAAFFRWSFFTALLAMDASSAFQLSTSKLIRLNRQCSHSWNAMPLLEDWEVKADGRLEGIVNNHPDYEDGSVISTSTFKRLPSENSVVETTTGSQYLLGMQSDDTSKEESLNFFFPKPIDELQGTMQEQGEEKGQTKMLMQQVKDAGIAGVISYALWELGFWTISIPVCIVAYYHLTGYWPDVRNQGDLQKLGAEAFAFVNVARFAVPLRIGLALGTTPWIQKNLVDRFLKATLSRKNIIVRTDIE
jgi:hypothetical protein